MPQPNALRVVVWITLSSSLLGALFAFAENRPHGIADFVNTELHGVLAGGLNGGTLSSLEILVLRGAYGGSLRQLPSTSDARPVPLIVGWAAVIPPSNQRKQPAIDELALSGLRRECRFAVARCGGKHPSFLASGFAASGRASHRAISARTVSGQVRTASSASRNAAAPPGL
jgi:hypothetical protein